MSEGAGSKEPHDSKIVKEEGTPTEHQGEGQGTNHQDSTKARKPNGTNSGLSYHYCGQTPDIGAILALRHEKFANKVVFSVFVERVKTYVLTNFEHASDMTSILDNLKDPKADIESKHPSELDPNEKSEVKKWVKQEEVKKFVKRLSMLEQNKETLYGLIWGQCSSGLQEVLKADENYTTKSVTFDCIWLLEKTKLVSAGVDSRANKHSTLVRALTSLCNIRQSATESNDSFRKRIDAYALTLKLAGGKHVMISPELIVEDKAGNPTEEEKTVEEDKFKSMLMILRSDPIRFGKLQESLFKGVYKGRDEFPTTVTQAYDLLQHIASDVTSYTRPTQRSGRFSRFRRNNRTSHVSFLQRGSNRNNDIVPGTDGRVYTHILCHGCGQHGHYKDKCPNVTGGSPRNTKVTLAHFTLTQKKLELINRDWLLLDTGSTISVCCNEALVENVKKCTPGSGVTVVTNGGSQTFEQVADLKLLPIQVHFNPESIANILSLTDIANLPGAKVTMDTSQERAIILHYDGKKFKFQECHDGLFFLDTSRSDNHNESVTAYSANFLQTVRQNKSVFSKQEIMRADDARKLQETIGWPSNSTYKFLINNNHINNCPVTVDDVNRATFIYGPAVPLLKGKMTRKHPRPPNLQYTPLPSQILHQHPTLQLYIDFFFVNKLPFLHTKSGAINFVTAQSGHT